MSNTNESQSAVAGPGASGARILGQAGALVLAIGVVSYLIWHAQVTADQQGAGGAGANVPAATGGADDQVMPSSKSRVMSFDKFGIDGQGINGQGTVLHGSKSGVMPSSKFLVLPPTPELRVPPVPQPTYENFRNPKKDVEPQQSVGGNKDKD